jgi:hypothetical protein
MKIIMSSQANLEFWQMIVVWVAVYFTILKTALIWKLNFIFLKEKF